MHIRRIVVTVIAVLTSAAFHTAGAQKLSVSINIAEVAMLSPNVDVGIVTGDRTSLHFDACYTNKPYGLSFKTVTAGTEFKLWLSGSPMIRMYVGGRLQYADYNYTKVDASHSGDAIMLGPTVGYDFSLSDRWNVEFSTGCGAAYFNERLLDVNDCKHTYDSGIRFVPLKIGISLVFIIA